MSAPVGSATSLKSSLLSFSKKAPLKTVILSVLLLLMVSIWLVYARYQEVEEPSKRLDKINLITSACPTEENQGIPGFLAKVSFMSLAGKHRVKVNCSSKDEFEITLLPQAEFWQTVKPIGEDGVNLVMRPYLELTEKDKFFQGLEQGDVLGVNLTVENNEYVATRLVKEK